jgi:RNA polymerase sigma-70 factor (ECF subfamily)
MEKDEQPWQAKAVWYTVCQMSLDDQRMIYLRYVLELSEEETAEALGIQTSTMRSRLHLALKWLCIRLDQDGPGFDEVITHE